MRKFLNLWENRISDWKTVFIQLAVVVFSFFFPLLFELSVTILCCAGVYTQPHPHHPFWDFCVGLVLARYVVHKCRQVNKNFMLNEGNRYHYHSYLGYWLASKLLGIRKCCLIRTPIYMQYKLILNHTFPEYYTGEDSEYRYIQDEYVTFHYTGSEGSADSSTINLIIEDTYSIPDSLLPEKVRQLNTVRIVRKDAVSSVRCFSPSFCKAVLSAVRNLPQSVDTINVFSTTNARHTEWIASNVFRSVRYFHKMSLRIYPQPHTDDTWKFSSNGHTVLRVSKRNKPNR